MTLPAWTSALKDEFGNLNKTGLLDNIPTLCSGVPVRSVVNEEMLPAASLNEQALALPFGRQLWHLRPAFTQAQLLHFHVLMHRQQWLTLGNHY